MGSQTLELKWANHKSNMISELQELYIKDALLDVTIACGEYNLKAHKTVLSASSTFFRKLFLDNPCKHPILVMTDVDFGDLKTIVEFIYHGEVHISRGNLTKFLKIAERLKIKGLSSIENINMNSSEQTELDVDSHQTNCEWENSIIQPKIQESIHVENVHSISKHVVNCTQSDNSEEITIVKQEDELPQCGSNNSVHWQSECFDQTSSSSALSVCLLPNLSVSHEPSVPSVSNELSAPSISNELSALSVSNKVSVPSVSHQLSTPSVSHQMPMISVFNQLSTASISHQLNRAPISHQQTTASVSHQVDSVSVSHKSINPSVSHQEGVPLSSEMFTYSESQIGGGTIMQEENTGRDIIPVTLSQSQNQSLTVIPSGTNPSFDTVEPLNSQLSSQADKTDSATFYHGKEMLNVLGTAVMNREENSESFDNLNYGQYNATNFKYNFSQKSYARVALEKHLQLRSMLKKFSCTICSFRCSRKSYLQVHLRTHTGEKPFVCNVCHKRFINSSNLHCHQRSHTGEKPFECSVCHKRFINSSNLHSHERSHTGERPYEHNGYYR